MFRENFSRLLEARDAQLRAQPKKDAARREDVVVAAHELADAIRAFTAGGALNLAVEGNKVILRNADDVLHITVEESGRFVVQHLSRDGTPVRDSPIIRGAMEAETMMDAILQWLGHEQR